MSSGIPAMYLQTAHRSIHGVQDARHNGDAQTLLMGSIANSLLGLLALGILREQGDTALLDAVQPLADEDK